MKGKIGLSLAFTGTNYGALWQAYATQQKIHEFGFETEIINYQKEKKHEFVRCPEAYYGHVLEIINERRGKKNNVNDAIDDIQKRNSILRKQNADSFREKRLSNIVTIKGLNNLRDYCSKNYSAVLVGSDQLWLPMVSFTYFRTLRFAPEGMKRISYATSLGVTEYPRYTWRKAKDFWDSIDYLSVREQQGADIIYKVTGRKPHVVLDPIYLFTKQEWEVHVPKQEVVKSGYVLCFILGDNSSMKDIARSYAHDNNLRLVCILSNEVSTNDTEYDDEVLIGQTPEAFINLIRNADCVFTDSFHGFAFSIINEKQVFVTYRIRKGTPSRNSRIDNIVNMFNVQHRLISEPQKGLPNVRPIDYVKVNRIIEEKRLYSLNFLEGALNG